MGYLEWSNEIRIVSISGQKLAEVMFYWSKFGGVLKLIRKAKTMILSLKSLKLPLGWCHIVNLIHWKWRLIKVSLKHSFCTYIRTKEGLCVKDQSEIFKRWTIYSHEKSPWWKTHFVYFVLIIRIRIVTGETPKRQSLTRTIILWVVQMLLRSNFKTKVKCE